MVGGDFALSIRSLEPTTSTSPPSSDPARISAVRALQNHTARSPRPASSHAAARSSRVQTWTRCSGSRSSPRARRSAGQVGAAGFKPVLAMRLGERCEGAFVASPDRDAGAVPVSLDPREVEMADKVVFAALANGTFQMFDLGTKLSVFHSQVVGSGATLNSIAYSSMHNLVAIGSGTGVVNFYIHALSQASANTEVCLAIATEHGLPARKPSGVSG